ncbi:methyl-accepting chemotaxis protein [Zoogloea sp.]|uniref:methyl-accepting chemotaxis protein n=1 Tax=Zoogloea sp. TaxID=49181 RepID=UPI0035B39280
MKSSSIATRILVGFALIATIFVAVAAYVTIHSARIEDASRQIEETFTPKLDAVTRLNDAIQQIRIQVRSAIIETEPATLTEVGRSTDQHIAAANSAMQRITELEHGASADQGLPQAALGIREQLQTFEMLSREIVSLGSNGAQADANRLFHAAHWPAALALNEATRVYLAQVRTANTTAIETLKASARQTTRAVIGGAATFVLFAAVIALAIARGIRHKLTDTLAAVKRIAGGDLSSDLQPQGKDEVAALQREVQSMQLSLREMVQTIRQADVRLHEATHHLSHATDQVRHGSETQAGLAASMAQSLDALSSSISHVSLLGSAASDTSTQAREHASSGALGINDMVDQITKVSERIEHSARNASQLGEATLRISEIVKVIQTVASQTNLLALNAAIESARAGEMGRGFAVVADEVRKLAEQSAQSTIQITSVTEAIQSGAQDVALQIQATVTQMQSGLAGAKQAGQEIDEIVANAETVMNVITEVSTGLDEQATASQQIARQIDEIVQMVEENAEAAAEVATAADDLTSLSAALSSSVGRFRLHA